MNGLGGGRNVWGFPRPGFLYDVAAAHYVYAVAGDVGGFVASIEAAAMITAARWFTRAPDFEPFYVDTDTDLDTDVKSLPAARASNRLGGNDGKAQVVAGVCNPLGAGGSDRLLGVPSSYSGHPIPAVMAAAFSLSYQRAGWIKYHDTVKLDIFDLGLGVSAGIILALTLPLVW